MIEEYLSSFYPFPCSPTPSPRGNTKLLTAPCLSMKSWLLLKIVESSHKSLTFSRSVTHNEQMRACSSGLFRGSQCHVCSLSWGMQKLPQVAQSASQQNTGPTLPHCHRQTEGRGEMGVLEVSLPSANAFSCPV